MTSLSCWERLLSYSNERAPCRFGFMFTACQTIVRERHGLSRGASVPPCLIQRAGINESGLAGPRERHGLSRTKLRLRDDFEGEDGFAIQVGEFQAGDFA